jgi:uncharacterized protein (TIGR02300 family)
MTEVTKPELGTKRRCNSCTTKFFDLNKDPIVCPKCMARSFHRHSTLCARGDAGPIAFASAKGDRSAE